MFYTKLLVLLAAALPQFAVAADTVTVHFDDLPGRETRRTAHMSNELTMNIEGDPELMKEMEAKGAKFPFTFVQRDVQTIVSRTESAAPDGSFRFERTIEESTGYIRDETGKEVEVDSPLAVLEGLSIRGTQSPDGTLEFSDFKGGDFDEEEREQLSAQLSQMMELFDYNAFDFASKEMSVGDEVSNDMTASIPVPGHPPVDFEIVTTHKLDKIADGRAYFTTRAAVTLQNPGDSVTANGKGSGEMVYEIEDKLMSRDIMDMEIKMQIRSAAPGAKMSLIVKGSTKVESKLVGPSSPAEASASAR